MIFLSTPSARRATDVHVPLPQHTGKISIHALREEGDITRMAAFCWKWISIHALREEGDTHLQMDDRGDGNFYPRPPRGGRLTNIQQFNKFSTISIHALREEGDLIPL